MTEWQNDRNFYYFLFFVTKNYDIYSIQQFDLVWLALVCIA